MIFNLLQLIALKLAILLLKPFSLNKTAKITAFITSFVGKRHRSSKIAYQNLKTIYPDMNDSEIKETIDKMWNNLGMTLGEFIKINDISDKDFLKLFDYSEASKLKQIYDKYGKIIVVSGHYGNWEIGPKICNMFDIKFSLIYRKANNPLINKEIDKIRSKYTAYLFNKGLDGTKRLVNTLKESSNIVLCILIDQKMNNGMNCNFLGHMAQTSTATAEIAIKYNMPIVIASIERIKPEVSKFNMFISDPIMPSEYDSYKLTELLNEKVGNMISRNKWQWFWVHNRWSFFKK